MEPGDRNHPTEQTVPVLAWTVACISCHDSDSALAHAQSNTSMGGVEACSVCHDPTSTFNVALEHKLR
jgi:hypothetical protein